MKGDGPLDFAIPLGFVLNGQWEVVRKTSLGKLQNMHFQHKGQCWQYHLTMWIGMT